MWGSQQKQTRVTDKKMQPQDEMSFQLTLVALLVFRASLHLLASLLLLLLLPLVRSDWLRSHDEF